MTKHTSQRIYQTFADDYKKSRNFTIPYLARIYLLSHSHLANILDVHRSTVSRWYQTKIIPKRYEALAQERMSSSPNPICYHCDRSATVYQVSIIKTLIEPHSDGEMEFVYFCRKCCKDAGIPNPFIKSKHPNAPYRCDFKPWVIFKHSEGYDLDEWDKNISDNPRTSGKFGIMLFNRKET